MAKRNTGVGKGKKNIPSQNKKKISNKTRNANRKKSQQEPQIEFNFLSFDFTQEDRP